MVSGTITVHNGAGLFGAYLAGLLNDVFGVSALLWPVAFIAMGARHVMRTFEPDWLRWLGLVLFGVCIATGGAAWGIGIGDLRGGGVLGSVLHRFAWVYLSPRGSTLAWLFLCLVALQLALDISWTSVLTRLWEKVRTAFADGLAADVQRQRKGFSLPSLSMPQLSLPRLSLPGRKAPHDGEGALHIDVEPLAQPASLVVDPLAMPAPGLAVAARQGETEAEGEEGHQAPNAQHGSAHASPHVVAGATGAHTQDASGIAGQRSGAAPSGSVSTNVADDGDDIVSLDDAIYELAPEEPLLPEGEDDGSGPVAKPRRKARIKLPGLDLLHSAPYVDSKPARDLLDAKGQSLVTCLADFGIQGELTRITPGPVVTMFEVRPAPGVKVSRIANLSDDLGLALKAIAVRIQAPIPGTDTVGIEIPNETRETVCFKELLASESFRSAEALLSMALGKDIAGRPTVADLARMPHLLVAGATGAGKSVCLNSILLSFLYKARPEDLKLLLIDPKRIELAVYADLPHLVHPVVTEMSQAKNALDWAVHEMEQRYEGMARLGVRNIASYNQKLTAMGADRPADLAGLEPLPYLVIIIDELADLMLTNAKEVETSIVRLAQLARAAGIHMILATQRPSVDVVTGLIKANFPCRISFQVTSKHDSRTILDTVGAEHLLGKGDMLFKPSGGKLQRLHGAFVSDDDVVAVVEYWKRQQAPSYRVDFASWGNDGPEEAFSGGNGGANGDLANDPAYAEAVDFVMAQGKASISLIQRRFRIGFNRAARYVEQMEQDGIIGPADGSKPRLVRGKE